MTVGAGPENDLVLTDDTVSRHHLEIHPIADGARVVDLGSTNGTFVGGARVTEVTLSPGSRLKAGSTELLLRPAEEEFEVAPSTEDHFGSVLGKSLAIRKVFGILEKVADSSATVLLTGETGTGKGAFARAIHDKSSRRRKPFVVVDCGAIPAPLMESELFGHEKGAFTGAIAARRGAFEQADDSTVFLDEVGELPLELQPKLLRVLESGEIRRVGGEGVRKINVRIVAATNRDLNTEVAEGRFREDLYYRLAVIRVRIPPLRERSEDIPLLIRSFMEVHGGDTDSLEQSTIAALQTYGWPGNVRELRNLVERSVLLTGGQIRAPQPDNAGRPAARQPIGGDVRGALEALTTFTAPFKEAKDRLLEHFEREYIRSLVERAGDGASISELARLSGLDRKHVRTLLDRHK